MEDQLTSLVDKIWAKRLETPPDRRLLIAVSGIPGSGKTTLALSLVAALNALPAPEPFTSPLALHLPMDGYHLTRAQLSALPDPATAHARRGAEFTFDGASFLSLVQTLRSPSGSPVLAPSFSHALKDPVPDAVAVLPLPAHAVVVVEGLYVLLDRDPWRAAAALMDMGVFVRVGRETAVGRLARRHLAAGIVGSEDEGRRRAVENDMVNGEVVERGLLPVDVVVESLEDGGWVHV